MFTELGRNSRFELKYRLNYFNYLKIRNMVNSYMKKDSFTISAGRKGYLVRSLYFDTYDYKAYMEKMNGDCDRIKFRIRSYDDTMREDTPIRVELKVRKANRVEKHSTFVKGAELSYFEQHRTWNNLGDPVLSEFSRHLVLKDLQPLIITKYTREGFKSRLNDGLRITIDHEVRSAHAKRLFPEDALFRQHHPLTVVLEIKFKAFQPAWLKELIHSYGLKLIANSKFTQGIQVARKDLHHPGGVVVVR